MQARSKLAGGPAGERPRESVANRAPFDQPAKIFSSSQEAASPKIQLTIVVAYAPDRRGRQRRRMRERTYETRDTQSLYFKKRERGDSPRTRYYYRRARASLFCRTARRRRRGRGREYLQLFSAQRRNDLDEARARQRHSTHGKVIVANLALVYGASDQSPAPTFQPDSRLISSSRFLPPNGSR